MWLFIPTAILLGALHGLEPGHSKTMMAAFIVAIRGTVWQAVLLGLSAAISHSLIIWVLAAGALHYGSQWDAERVEPFLQIGSAVFIFALAAWMYLRTRRELAEAHQHHHGHSHSHDHSDHGHEHGHHHAHDERILVPTGHGDAELSIFEKDTPPVFRLVFTGTSHAPADFALETLRDDGTRQIFVFAAKEGFYESTTAIPEPHEFDVLLTFTDGGHEHTARVQFREGEEPRVANEAGEYQDAHERAHAHEIAQRFAGQKVPEKVMALDVALRLRSALNRTGFRTVMTRTTDVLVPLAQRAAVANAHPDAIFGSVHFNASPNSGPRGIETYYATGPSRPIAVHIQSQLAPSVRRAIGA